MSLFCLWIKRIQENIPHSLGGHESETRPETDSAVPLLGQPLNRGWREGTISFLCSFSSSVVSTFNLNDLGDKYYPRGISSPVSHPAHGGLDTDRGPKPGLGRPLNHI